MKPRIRPVGGASWAILSGIVFVMLVWTGCSRSSSNQRNAYFQAGMKYYQEGSYADAEIEFANAVKSDPHFAQGYYYLGLTGLKRGDSHSAFLAFREEMQVDPKQIPGATHLANLYLVANQPAEAENWADSILARDPHNWSAELILAQSYLGEGKYARALKELRGLKAANLKDGAIDFVIGIAEVGEGDYEGAASSIEHGISLNPGSPEGYEDLARLYEKTGRQALAVETLQEGMKKAQDSSSLYFALADVFCLGGRWADAKGVLASLQKEHGRTSTLESSIGDFWMAHNKPGLASEEYESAYALSPSIVLDKKCTEAYIALGNATEAERWNRAVLRADPTDEQGLLFSGVIAYLQGHPAGAIEQLRQALKGRPNSVFGRYYLGMSLMAIDRGAQAKIEFLDCVKEDPQFAYAYLRLGQVSLRSGNTRSGAQYTRELIHLDPTMPEGYLLLFDVSVVEGNIGKAEQSLALARRFAPDLAAVTVRQAILDGFRKDYAKAETEYERALKESGNPTPILTGLAEIYVRQDQIANAVQEISHYASGPWVNSELFVLLAELQLKQNNLPAAEIDCHRALGINSQSANAYFYLGQIAERRGNDVASIADYARAAELSPSGARADLSAGDLSRRLGRWAEAQRYYRSALERQSGMPLAQAGLARTMLDLGEDSNVALGLAQQALSSAPSDPVTADDLGWVYFKEGLPKLAIPLLEQATKEDPRQGSFRLHLGMAYSAAGEKTQARQALREARSLGLTQPEAKEDIQALAELSKK